MFLLSIADFVIGNNILWGTESRYEEYYFTPRFSGDLGGILVQTLYQSEYEGKLHQICLNLDFQNRGDKGDNMGTKSLFSQSL